MSGQTIDPGVLEPAGRVVGLARVARAMAPVPVPLAPTAQRGRQG